VAVDPLAQPIDPLGRFSLSAPVLSGNTLLNYRTTCSLGQSVTRRVAGDQFCDNLLRRDSLALRPSRFSRVWAAH
jgi:hypothetical protein